MDDIRRESYTTVPTEIAGTCARVEPGLLEIDLPGLLDFPAPHLRAYARENCDRRAAAFMPDYAGKDISREYDD